MAPGSCRGPNRSRWRPPPRNYSGMRTAREVAMETTLSTQLADRIQEATGENVFLCYQCIKCTSGCPLAEHFDLAPNQVLRAAQLGMEESLVNNRTPWLCAP